MFARTIGKLIGWIMLPLIAVIMFDVVTRKLDVTRLYFAEYTAQSGYSVSTILQDMQWHFHGALLMLTFGFGYLANAHVRVDVFRELLQRRTQGWLELVGLIVCAIPFLILMINYSFDMTVLAFHQGEGSESMTGIGQRWIIKSAVVIGFVILMAAVIATLIRLVAYLFGNEAQQQEALDGLEIFADDHDELEAARLEAERALQESAEHPEGSAGR
jgi:TRAP-type mannitol/chloroaromatic compound transport system permease small subunit